MAVGRGRLNPRAVAVGILVISLLIVSYAVTVTIFRANYADQAGVFLRPYFEFQNAPVTGCTSPCLTVDTQTTQPNPSFGTLGSDGSSTGVWSTGSSFTITASTTKANDVILVFAITSVGASSITVSSITDSQSKVTWQASARLSYTSCAASAQELTQTEWYGVASTTITSDVITVQLSGTPTIASGVEFAISGANTNAPFDPNIGTPPTNTKCAGGSNTTPTVSGFTTTNANDFVFALFGGYNSVTETAGTMVGGTGNLLQTVTGTGDSLAAEYLIVSTTQSAQSCAFGTASNKWGVQCDAIVQASGSFALAAGANMYLWTPQYATATTIPAGALSFQLFAALPAPALDGSTTGTWTTGTTFTLSALTTANANDVIVLSMTTYKSGSSVTVTGVSDSQSKVTWAGSARSSFVTCSGVQETTHIEWYGTTSSTLSGDVITITLSTTPTSASGIGFGISGADTTTPFDPASGLPVTASSDCTATNSTPTVSGLKTIAYNDFVFSLMGAEVSVTETAGTISGSSATLITTVAGVGDSNGAEYLTVANPITASASCSFGGASVYWGVLCDSILPARRSITVSYVTTNSAGTVQSTMIAGSSATITALDAGISLSSSSGSVPASGYVRVIITGPSVGITVYWGYGSPTNFQVSYTYVT